jgi:hypothetical protein
MRSKTAWGTLVRQPFRVQTYFGVFGGTYILAPQWQKVRPPKSCTGLFGAGVRFARRSAKRALAAFQSSSGTTAQAPVLARVAICPHRSNWTRHLAWAYLAFERR